MKKLPGLPGIYVSEGKKNITYYALVQDRNGKWKRRKVGTKIEGCSPAVAAVRKVELQKQLRGGIDPGQNEKVTYGRAHENYLSVKKANGSDITRDVDRHNLYLCRFDDAPLSILTTNAFNELKLELVEKGLSPGYMEKIFGQARTVIGWAIKDQLWQGVNPIGRDSRFKMPSWRKGNKPTKWFTPEEASKLLNTIANYSKQLHDMCLLSLRTGMRSMEIFGLGELEDAVDSDNGQLNFLGKSGGREWCYADDEVIRMLLQYKRRPGELIFQDRYGQRIKKISKTFQRALVEADLLSETHKVWFHSWRHTFGSWLAQSGEFTLQEIMEYMRHQDERMTAHYAKLIPGQKRDLVAGVIRGKMG